jgi:hypothetical protein
VEENSTPPAWTDNLVQSAENLSSNVSNFGVPSKCLCLQGLARYTEAIDLLYTEKTFTLRSTGHFPAWVRAIPHRHRRLVRHLVLHFSYERNYLPELWKAGHWDGTFAALGWLTSLKTLRIIVEDYHVMVWELQ